MIPTTGSNMDGNMVKLWGLTGNVEWGMDKGNFSDMKEWKLICKLPQDKFGWLWFSAFNRLQSQSGPTCQGRFPLCFILEQLQTSSCCWDSLLSRRGPLVFLQSWWLDCPHSTVCSAVCLALIDTVKICICLFKKNQIKATREILFQSCLVTSEKTAGRKTVRAVKTLFPSISHEWYIWDSGSFVRVPLVRTVMPNCLCWNF